MKLRTKFLLVFMLTGVLFLLAGGITLIRLRTVQLRRTAQTVAEQVIAFRSWVANTGGVWVDHLSPAFPDYLGKEKEADGTVFYSKNPALATRELSQIVFDAHGGATFRVTSDNYRNPLNKPDPFELDAVKTFRKDKKIPYVEEMDGDLYRYAVPLVMTAACLKCHGRPADAPPSVIEKFGAEKAFGYHLGDVRGIIAVNLPKGSLFALMTHLLNGYSFLLLLGALLLNYLFVEKVLISRISGISSHVKAIAGGDYSASVGTKNDSEDEIEVLVKGIDTLAGSFDRTVREVYEIAGNVTETVRILRESAETTRRGAQKQCEQAAHIARTTEGLNQTFSEIVEDAGGVYSVSSAAMKEVGKGKEMAGEAIRTTNRVLASTNALEEMVRNLSGRTEEIGEIITLIDEIADQTNLLALNAAIEAARAGEQGRGFTVVADEVRNLAEKILTLTKEISGRIGAVHSETVATRTSMEESAREVQKATEDIREVGGVLDVMVETVEVVRDRISNISETLNEQLQVSGEVARTTEETSSIAREMEGMSAEVIEKIDGLIGFVERMNRLSGFFRK